MSKEEKIEKMEKEKSDLAWQIAAILVIAVLLWFGIAFLNSVN